MANLGQYVTYQSSSFRVLLVVYAEGVKFYVLQNNGDPVDIFVHRVGRDEKIFRLAEDTEEDVMWKPND